MSFDVMTLALAKSYTDQHGGGGGGENTIYIPVTLKASGDSLTIETSATFEQVDTAYKSGQEQILKLFTDDSGESAYLLPLICGVPGGSYYFETVILDTVMAVVVRDTGWSITNYDFTPTPKEEIVNDVLAALPTWTGGSY